MRLPRGRFLNISSFKEAQSEGAHRPQVWKMLSQPWKETNSERAKLHGPRFLPFSAGSTCRTALPHAAHLSHSAHPAPLPTPDGRRPDSPPSEESQLDSETDFVRILFRPMVKKYPRRAAFLHDHDEHRPPHLR